MNDIYDFLSGFEKDYSEKHPQETKSSGSGPMDRAAAEALGYKPLLDKAPDIQPCEYGYPCNDCGFCH